MNLTIKKNTQFPKWLKKKLPATAVAQNTARTLSDLKLTTVCQSAKCPNIWECFSKKIATFMIMGNICTRNCKFCGVQSGIPSPLEEDEPKRVAEAVKKFGLKHVVITSVTRDDLPDGGAAHFVKTIKKIRWKNPEVSIEVLIPDFQGNENSIKKIIEKKPLIINHNIETVPSLYSTVRPQADYQRSLNLLKFVKQTAPDILTKSGLMVGLGETCNEVIQTMQDLRKVHCQIITIGQYLRTSPEHIEISQFIHPTTFKRYAQSAKRLGFLHAYCDPYVRSSYNAYRFVRKYQSKQ